MIMQGYLHKMKRKTLFGGSWNKRFFKVEPSLNKTAFQFNYYTNSKSPNPQQVTLFALPYPSIYIGVYIDCVNNVFSAMPFSL